MESDVKTLLGTPFKYGGRTAEGMDCYGVLIEDFRQRGIELEDPLEYDGPVATGETDVFDENKGSCWEEVVGTPQKGDVITFSKNGGDIPTHCGILKADGKVLHATEGHGVILTPMRWLRKRLCRTYRYRCRA